MTPGEDLLSLIRRRIASRGRISFREFMETALYEPGLGRYHAAAPPMGPSGDYITSPEVDDAFGLLLGRALGDMHRRLDPGPRDGPFTVVEVGPGRGTLCRDILRGLREEAPALHASLRYVLVESSDTLRGVQERLLGREPACAGRVSWSRWGDLAGGPPLTGCLLANEFLDALPVHLVERRGGRVREIHVVEGEGGALAEEPGDLSSPAISEHLRREGIVLREGQRAEVNLEALAWIREAAALLGRGYAVIIDYGHEAEDLYSRRHFAGTLMGYRRHRAVTDLLDRPGEQDLTSHVDFTALRRAATAAGFTAFPIASQRNVLVNLGLPEMIAGLALPQGRRRAPGDPEEEGARVRKRFALHALMSPGGMGTTFKVLVLGKGEGASRVPWLKDPFREPVEAAGIGMYTPPGPGPDAAFTASGAPSSPPPDSRIQRRSMPSDSATLTGQALRSALRGAGSAAEGIARMVGCIHESNPLYTWTGVYLLEGRELVLAHQVGKPTPHARIPLDKGICGAAASSGATIIVDDVNADPRYLACSLETRSEIVVPLKGSDGRVLGEIDIDSDTRSAFDEGDRKALELAAGILSEFLEAPPGGGTPPGEGPEVRPRRSPAGGGGEAA